MNPSTNEYDWLGNGIYFWENSHQRALDWARHKYGRNAAVLGAAIDLGHCLNLADYSSVEILRTAFRALEVHCIKSGKPLPVNKQSKDSGDILLRNLDCAVIEQLHDILRESNSTQYDSVRGVFLEGGPMYKGSALLEKTHVQLCVRNPNCIKGYFRPLELNSEYSNP